MGFIKGTYLFVGGRGCVYALKRDSGQVAWETPLKEGWFKKGRDFVSVIEGLDHLYAVSYGIVFAIDKESGTIIWQSEIRHLRHAVATLAIDGAVMAPPTCMNEVAAEGEADGPGDGNGNGGNGGD